MGKMVKAVPAEVVVISTLFATLLGLVRGRRQEPGDEAGLTVTEWIILISLVAVAVVAIVAAVVAKITAKASSINLG